MSMDMVLSFWQWISTRKNSDPVKRVFLGASGIFGAVPGLTIIGWGLGSPPGYLLLFGGTIEVFGTLTVLLLWVNRKRLKRLTAKQTTGTVLVLIALSLCLVVVYLQLTGLCIANHPIHGSVYYPLWKSGHLAEMVDRAGGRYAAVERYGSYPVAKAIQEAPGYPFTMVVTTIVMLLTYQGIFTSLAIAFGVLGIRSEERAQSLPADAIHEAPSKRSHNVASTH